MDSSTSRATAAQKRQAELKVQIAALQAQLVELPNDQACTMTAPSSPKRKNPEPTLLAPATPSPKKKRRVEAKRDARPQPRISQPSFQKHQKAIASSSKPSAQVAGQTDSAPSKFLSKLAEVKSRSCQNPVLDIVNRTSAFSERTRPSRPTEGTEVSGPGPGLRRDERLALVEELEPGPYEFTPPSDDPDFQHLEPHSGIRLLSRALSHEDLQEHLQARYYLSPSRLYSTVLLLPDKQGYDVPVLGDWVTIAVVAERGPVKLTRAPITLDPDEPQDKKPWKKGKDKTDGIKKPMGKKYVNFKLVDFGARSNSSANGAQSVIRGDAFLTLLLFESDGFDLIQREDGQKPQKLYKGGSRGAFELMAKVKEGDVIALLNPKILKPFQRSNDTPHPVNNVLALTPESAESIAVIGRSRDLGMCGVIKRDGKSCGSWCDKRVSDVCDYHLHNAVQHRRAGRAEFTAGTSGMSNTSVQKQKHNYDPARKWGLKPEETTGGSTYVISGHVVSGSGTDPRSMYVAEAMGREGQAKAQRKSGTDADRALKKLLERDRDGMKAVILAREANGVSNRAAKVDEGEKKRTQSDMFGEDLESFDDGRARPGKNAYSAEVIKQLGFDPTTKGGLQKRLDNSDTQKKLEALRSIKKSRKDVTLVSRSGPKIRSGVIAPKNSERASLSVTTQIHQPTGGGPRAVETDMIDLDDC